MQFSGRIGRLEQFSNQCHWEGGTSSGTRACDTQRHIELSAFASTQQHAASFQLAWRFVAWPIELLHRCDDSRAFSLHMAAAGNQPLVSAVSPNGMALHFAQARTSRADSGAGSTGGLEFCAVEILRAAVQCSCKQRLTVLLLTLSLHWCDDTAAD
jgi:hypothetical protein